VISTCLNEAVRIDRQLYGRCARQGDPGSYKAILSLEDELLTTNISPTVRKVLYRICRKEGAVNRRFGMLALSYCQKKTEFRHREARRRLLQQDRQLGKSLAFTGILE
jgi:preprotein translocase subunit SecA